MIPPAAVRLGSTPRPVVVGPLLFLVGGVAFVIGSLLQLVAR